jgi:hypothetical protein
MQQVRKAHEEALIKVHEELRAALHSERVRHSEERGRREESHKRQLHEQRAQHDKVLDELHAQIQDLREKVSHDTRITWLV